MGKHYSMSAALLAFAVFFLSSFVSAQAGPNTLAKYNPSLQTMSQNGTLFILAINRTLVQSVVGSYKLLPVPTSDKSIFPNGFPASAHPVLASSSYENDIRMGSLQIDTLLAFAILIPYVDRLGDGKTPFKYSLPTLLSGPNNSGLQGLAPALVATFAAGSTSAVGSFMPDNLAWQALGSKLYSFNAKQVIVPNPVSGPSVKPAAADLIFTSAARGAAAYTSHAYHAMLNQPLILSNGMCRRVNYYFNETFTNEVLRVGNMTLYSGIYPKALAGCYVGQGGLTANSEVVGYNPQSCPDAAAQNDPTSLQ